MFGQVIDDFYDSWPFCWFWHTHAAIQCGCVDFFRMQNAKSGISKVSDCRALKIFNWCQFHPFSKTWTIPTSQQFEGATSYPKGIWENEDIVFLCEILPDIFFSLCIFFPGKFQLTALNAGWTQKSRRRGFVRRRILTSSKVLWKIGGSAWVSGNSRRIQRHQKKIARPQVASCSILLLLCSIANIPEP